MQLCTFKQDLCVVFELDITLKIHMEEKKHENCQPKVTQISTDGIFTAHNYKDSERCADYPAWPAGEMVDG